MKYYVVLILVLFVVSAHSHDWKDVTNQEIIQELSVRLNSGPSGWVGKVSYSCDRDDLVVTLLTNQGNLKTSEYDLYNDKQCQEEVLSLSLMSGKLYGTRTQAACYDDDLVTVTVDPVQLHIVYGSRKDVGDREDCRRLADSLNSDRG